MSPAERFRQKEDEKTPQADSRKLTAGGQRKEKERNEQSVD